MNARAYTHRNQASRNLVYAWRAFLQNLTAKFKRRVGHKTLLAFKSCLYYGGLYVSGCLTNVTLLSSIAAIPSPTNNQNRVMECGKSRLKK